MQVISIDLSKYDAQLPGGHAGYFLDVDGPGIRVVEHATGKVRFKITPEGALVPYDPPKPNGAQVTATVDAHADLARFSAGV